MFSMTATYSPDDNKLRLYSVSRLDADDYARVKAAGFKWAPQQKLFVAPMWTPERADLLIDLCGEIGDEDTSLTERAEERAERFEEYAENRADDAEHAHAAVKQLTDGIPLGQPILVGHHSERHARKDAERITNGMRKAVKMWETSKYWEARAKGALLHAKYKELPGVRHRRIKGLLADKRTRERVIDHAQQVIAMWTNPDQPLTLARAKGIANLHDHYSRCFTLAEYPRTVHCYEGMMTLWSALGGSDDDTPIITPEQARDLTVPSHERQIARAQRWLTHIENRLTYERAMLADAGGLITTSSAYPIVVGGRVLVGEEWLMVLRVNRANGEINSVRTQKPIRAYWCSLIPIERVKDYQPPTIEDTRAAKERTKLAPLVNYKGEGFVHMTLKEYQFKVKCQYAVTRHILATAEYGAHRQRESMIAGCKLAFVFITDGKEVARPSPEDSPNPTPLKRVSRETPAPAPTPAPVETAPNDFEAMKDSLKAGIQVVSAPQLFPTPINLAARMIAIADIQPGQRVLEPSAGTGNLIGAMGGQMFTAEPRQGEIVAVEINHTLANQLRTHFPLTEVIAGDFLAQTELGQFDRIVMNSPFINGADIKHIQRARTLLKMGGRLVALCANGPRQQATLKPLAAYWEDLPEGTFAPATNVNCALLVMEA